jgi:hypothetical protein
VLTEPQDSSPNVHVRAITMERYWPASAVATMPPVFRLSTSRKGLLPLDSRILR